MSAPGNNYHGIKAGKSWKGQKQLLPTTEYDSQGRKYRTKDWFRVYDSPSASHRDWAKTVARNWPGALSAWTFGDALAALKMGEQGGYATDPNYNDIAKDRYRRFERSQAVQKYNFAADAIPSYWTQGPKVDYQRATMSMMNGGVLGLDGRTAVEAPVLDQPDSIDTRSIRGQRAVGSAMPVRGSSDSVASYARLLRAMLGDLGSARPSPGPQNGQAAANNGRMDTVAVTRMIREMQQAGASPDEIRQMIAENRRRASATRAAPR
jgi:hypothetical protein